MLCGQYISYSIHSIHATLNFIEKCCAALSQELYFNQKYYSQPSLNRLDTQGPYYKETMDWMCLVFNPKEPNNCDCV